MNHNQFDKIKYNLVQSLILTPFYLFFIFKVFVQTYFLEKNKNIKYKY